MNAPPFGIRNPTSKAVNIHSTDAKLSNTGAETIFDHHYRPYEKHVLFSAVKNANDAASQYFEYRNAMDHPTFKIPTFTYKGNLLHDDAQTNNIEGSISYAVKPDYESFEHIVFKPSLIYNIFNQAATTVDFHRYISEQIKKTPDARIGDVVIFSGHNTWAGGNGTSRTSEQQIIDIYQDHPNVQIYTYAWPQTLQSGTLSLDSSLLDRRFPPLFLIRERNALIKFVSNQLRETCETLKALPNPYKHKFDIHISSYPSSSHGGGKNVLGIEELLDDISSEGKRARSYLLQYAREAEYFLSAFINGLERDTKNAEKRAELSEILLRTRMIQEYLEVQARKKIALGVLKVAAAHVSDHPSQEAVNEFIDGKNWVRPTKNGEKGETLTKFNVNEEMIKLKIQKTFRRQFDKMVSYESSSGSGT